MKQITILAEGKKDLIADITQMLANANIDIDTITGENYGGRSVVTVTVGDYNAAMQVIEQHRCLQIMSEDALIVRVEDELGALAKLSSRFASADINIRSIRFVERHDGHALVAISTERPDKARELIKDILVS